MRISRKSASTALLLTLAAAGPAHAERVSIEHDAASPQASYAARRLGEALSDGGHEVRFAEPGARGFVVRLRVQPERLRAEAFALTPAPEALSIEGGDARGLIYGALAAAEALRNGTPLREIRESRETPRLGLRAIKFNTPWDTYRPSSALDQHYATARDVRFWEAFLDMMVENRFNAISLWTLHPFTYMIRPKSFPEASPWTELEFEEWRRLYREIFRLAKERGLDTYVVHWSIFVSEPFAKAHGSESHVGGYFLGSETYIPALDYFTAVQEPVRWKWAFERQWLFYKLWGRLLYDPETPDAVFEAEFVRRYGPKAGELLRAYSLASATQLRLASLYDSRWDFTLYGEGFLALQGDHTKYISVDQLIRQPVMDPDYVSVADFVDATRRGVPIAAGRVTPPALADRLERDNREALRLVAAIDTKGDASLRYEVADVQAWAYLGLHLAEKLRGAVALQSLRLGGSGEQKARAVAHLEGALGHWDELVRLTRPLYRDMKLTHYNHNFFVASDQNLFHWALVREEVAADVATARSARVGE